MRRYREAGMRFARSTSSVTIWCYLLDAEDHRKHPLSLRKTQSTKTGKPM